MRAMKARRPLCAFVAIAAGLTFVPMPSGADPSERLSTSADAERINLTIYNGGISLVHDRRRIALENGTNSIAWRDVSGNMDASSAILDDLTTPGATTVVEQNFDFDLLRPTALLDKYVGHQVTVVHDKSRPGEPHSENATLLSDNDGVVLKYSDRVETGLYDSHIVFPSIPENLRDRPTLVLDLASTKAGTRDLDLSYLTGGLGWHADYVGVVSPDETHMNVGGLVTLTNTTGTTFPHAHLQLVAGNVNTSSIPAPIPYSGLRSIASVRPAEQENFFEYHLYTFDRPTTVANAQTKQVSLLSAKNVPIKKTLELRGSESYYSNANADLGAKLKVGVYITFTNKGGDLGIPLPGGTFRLYKNDSKGTSQFLGSDAIDHTPRDQDVRLHLGDSFDVTANKKQTSFKIVGLCTYDSSYAIAVSNAKDEAQDVFVVEPLPGDWSILSENIAHQKTSSSTATWHVAVPSRKTVTLEYTAHVSFCS
jgi:hypothetical protein